MVLAAASALAVSAPAAVASDTGPYAPVDRPGPSLSVPVAKLQAALSCTPGIAGDGRNPILLVRL